MKPRTAAQQRHLASSPFQAKPEPTIEQFAVGDRVTHDKYGLGRILDKEEEAVTVAFGDQQIRITSPFHKMTKL
ncbi:hypothetical protein [Nocardioides mesophilus]|uniref:Uncharacterized protein n=1 Tax=Nocardioides mesophilus TaxID=433659 RepID=A0A7G9R7X1_9ACTN|nr:hypothetical protein [Nocardioides mesophilus]QNN51696.1 hypothetical protein H9L09_14135 [Nocardioides mesophilus]